MEIRVDKLRRLLEQVAPALPRGKVTLPITTSVLFGGGKLTATNLEFWISVDLPELDAKTSFVLPHKALALALKFTPGNEVITLTPQRANVILETSKSKLTLVKPAQPRDFPPMPELVGDGFRIDGDLLVKGLMQVHPYIASDEARAVLTGVAIRLADEVEMVAADGFRLAITSPGITLYGEGTGHQPVVPGRTVSVLDRLWRGADKSPDFDAARVVGETPNRASVDIGRLAVAKRYLNMLEDGTHIRFMFSNVTLCSNLLQGTFPDYTNLMPNLEGGRRVSVDAQELLRSVNQVAQIASGGSNIVRLNWGDDRIVVSAHALDVGDVEATIAPVVIEGEPAQMGFNVNNLRGYLRDKDHVVTLSTAPTDDDVIRSVGAFSHRGSPMVLLMPMMVQAAEVAQPPDGQDPVAETESESAAEPAEAATEPTTEEGVTPSTRRRRRSAPVSAPAAVENQD